MTKLNNRYKSMHENEGEKDSISFKNKGISDAK